MKTRFTKAAAAVAVAALTAFPLFAAGRGSANFQNFVAIGDSYGAGYESGALNANHQVFSWPAIIARQVGLTLCEPTAVATTNCFAQPLVSGPNNELTLRDLGGTITPSAGGGSPLMLTFGRPYNNLSIPGATVTDVITLTGKSTEGAASQLVLRGLGTEVQLAAAQHPTFIAIWIGGNDLLGATAAGMPALLTPTDKFKASYEAMLDQLIAAAPSAGMVVGTLPTNAQAVPYVSTIPPFLVNGTAPVLGPDGKPIYYVADLGGGNFGQLPAGSFVLLPALAKIRTGYGIPAALGQIPPFNQLPNVGKPLADSDVLTPTEAAAIVTRANEYNAVITAAAAARNIPVADIKGLFDRVVVNPATGAGGINVGPVRLTNAFVTGGFFSLDGVHLTDLGYILFANEYIKAINNGYNAGIPLASITQVFANNGAMFGHEDDSKFNPGSFSITSSAAAQMKAVWSFASASRRFRAASH
ncbi:MAG TPA: SGNH/GDSL hydrolase family protein [Thermoanaerobaculia bacterium]|nr:SGNH/GDSL hydrolase family protein [Thermoanaerobaculia bacterium]